MILLLLTPQKQEQKLSEFLHLLIQYSYRKKSNKRVYKSVVLFF